MSVSKLAIVALIMSILGIFFIPFALIGIILAVFALKNISKNQGSSGKGLAFAALVVGIFSIVLFLFAILFGMYVLNFGKAYLEKTDGLKTNEKSYLIDRCNDTKVLVQSIGEKYSICNSAKGIDSKLSFTVFNAGVNPIDGLAVSVFGSNGVEVKKVEVIIPPAGSSKQVISYDLSNTGTVKKIIIAPIERIDVKSVTCSSSASIVEVDESVISDCEI